MLLKKICLAAVLVFCFACAGEAIGDAQNFVSNNPPRINDCVSLIVSPELDSFSMRGDVLCTVKVSAYDPDGDAITYSYTSQYGTFGKRTFEGAYSAVQFLTNNNVTGGVPVIVRVTVTDEIGASAFRDIQVGLGKPSPAVTVLAEPGSSEINSGGNALIDFTADCDGYFQIVCRNDFTAETAAIDSSIKIYPYKKNSSGIYETVILTAAGPSSVSAGDVKLSGVGINKVWVIFCDYVNKDEVRLCEIKVN